MSFPRVGTGPRYRIQTAVFEAAFLIGDEDEPNSVHNVDAKVRLLDGSRWSATIFTIAEVDRLITRWSRTGEHADGSYFWCSDGVIVRDPGVESMTRVLAELHNEGILPSVLHRLDELDV